MRYDHDQRRHPTEATLPAAFPVCGLVLKKSPVLVVCTTHAISCGPDRRAACDSKLRDGLDRQLDRVVGQQTLHVQFPSHDSTDGDRATIADWRKCTPKS